jgi:hypothetical protein
MFLIIFFYRYNIFFKIAYAADTGTGGQRIRSLDFMGFYLHNFYCLNGLYDPSGLGNYVIMCNKRLLTLA